MPASRRRPIQGKPRMTWPWTTIHNWKCHVASLRFSSNRVPRPNEPWDIIEERYGFCEALATMLVATAKIKVWQLQVTEDDVLDRIYRSLQGGEAGVNPVEARWVITRLAELLEWEQLPLGDKSL